MRIASALAILVPLLATGCLEPLWDEPPDKPRLQYPPPTRTRQSYVRGGPLRLVVGGGVGTVVPYDDEYEGEGASAFHVGVGQFGGGGLRIMELNYTAGGQSYEADAVLGYVGLSVAGGGIPGGGTMYCGVGLGGVDAHGGGVHDEAFAAALCWGWGGYYNFPDLAVGGVLEVCCFFARPADLPLSAATFLIGVYVQY